MTKSSRSQNHSHLLRYLLEEEGEGLVEQALKQKKKGRKKTTEMTTQGCQAPYSIGPPACSLPSFCSAFRICVLLVHSAVSAIAIR